MKPVLPSIKPVLAAAKSVKINHSAIIEFCKTVTKADLAGSEFHEATIIKGLSEEEYIAFCFVDSALNFCYWGEPKWTVQIEGQDWDGSAALIRCLKQALQNGYPILQSSYLATMPESDLQEVFKGNVVIPLLAERLRLLRELGQVLQQRFGGSFKSVVDESKWDALALVDLIVRNCPNVFDDSAEYRGRKVGFYKRAQLLPLQLHDIFEAGLINKNISGYQELTTLADYKIPQHLRKFGILEYSPALAQKVDTLIELPEGGEEEVEIRAATIWAVEVITQELRKRFSDVAPTRVGLIFWFKGQVKSADDKPYHRTLTVWY
jgi:hypothetical protein